MTRTYCAELLIRSSTDQFCVLGFCTVLTADQGHDSLEQVPTGFARRREHAGVRAVQRGGVGARGAQRETAFRHAQIRAAHASCVAARRCARRTPPATTHFPHAKLIDRPSWHRSRPPGRARSAAAGCRRDREPLPAGAGAGANVRAGSPAQPFNAGADAAGRAAAACHVDRPQPSGAVRAEGGLLRLCRAATQTPA